MILKHRVFLFVIYSFLTLFHSIGILGNIYIFCDTNVNLIKSGIIMINFIWAVPIVISEIIILLSISDTSDYYERFWYLVDVLDAYCALYFICIFSTINHFKISSLLKGIGGQFYVRIYNYILIKFIVAIACFYLGLSLCAESSRRHYIPLSTAFFFAFSASVHTIFLIFTNYKLKLLKIGITPPAGIASASGISIEVGSAKGSTRSNGHGHKFTEMEKAVIELGVAFNAIPMNIATLLSTAILVPVFYDASFRSGLIYSIGWRLTAGVGLALYPIVFLKSKDT